MKSKIGLALALALLVLGINQANAAMIYFNCTYNSSNFDLQVNTTTGSIVGAEAIIHSDDPPWMDHENEKFTKACKISSLEFSCKEFDKTGREISLLSLSRVSGRLTFRNRISDNPFSPIPYDCKLIPKKLF